MLSFDESVALPVTQPRKPYTRRGGNGGTASAFTAPILNVKEVILDLCTGQIQSRSLRSHGERRTASPYARGTC